ncbi:hypothetical protein PKNA1_C2_0102700 [Plasmodium knowlesi strain H]|uniref:Uncharacterized protein n=3 Tax=Plasmodium knowlesi TaxID=5850 RepID=A0A5K1UPK5_PLAKH|nr:uncharacterized protein PKNH_0102700 [Plasmodium knowlesi strain H]OTN68638.1 Uncharacterized protein PKNOH_S01011000 [Plasmodium knowlesi]CAA9986111.1 hypothetical protein PKNH_0102700 [Plasmodium knowlesi strain H]SBO25275.1 hypothetical protein PKNA1_C2_0102700 [Plasmodium knowlesi strain H]SBO27607.1 hypothetical protein PKNA1_H1_0102700 [Plasmodium knowlesi strain H]VVS75585.1 hypothetical protein PKNH_0102700 [Plasmodium knowlesi strain H]|eukprot:XP_002257522.1 hypothetical protein PKH_010270 [Plasmodium knowlesi strain H]
MAYHTGSPYSLYSMMDVNSPLSSFGENYYVSEPYHPPHTPVISNMFHGSFPSYYEDDDDDYYNEEDFLMEESEISRHLKSDENKTGNVENKTEKIENKTGNVENKTGKVENKTGNVENKTGNVANKTGKVENKTGNVENKTGNVANKTGEVENKTGNVENKAEKVENEEKSISNRNSKLTLFQAVMIMVLVMRLGRKRCKRLRKKHEARKKLLKFLDKVNERIKKDDLKMENKLKRLKVKIQKERTNMEKKWNDKRKRVRDEVALKPSKEKLPGIGPFYDENKRLLDRKLDIVDMNYEKYKYNKEKEWNAMKARYHKNLKKVHDRQQKRKRLKCRRMFLFERRWNFGPKTMHKFLKQRGQKVEEAKVLDMIGELGRIEIVKAQKEEKIAEVHKAAEEAKNGEAAKLQAAHEARVARGEKLAGLIEAAERAEAAKKALATAAAREEEMEEDDDDEYYYYVDSDDEYYDDSDGEYYDDSDDYYDEHPPEHGYEDEDA